MAENQKALKYDILKEAIEKMGNEPLKEILEEVDKVTIIDEEAGETVESLNSDKKKAIMSEKDDFKRRKLIAENIELFQ